MEEMRAKLRKSKRRDSSSVDDALDPWTTEEIRKMDREDERARVVKERNRRRLTRKLTQEKENLELKRSSETISSTERDSIRASSPLNPHHILIFWKK